MGKRIFDVVFSLIALLLVGWLILFSWFVATLETGMNGFFLQKRIGRFGEVFTIIKLRTMKKDKVTRFGSFLRNSKIDELPQFLNVLKGDMSIVGPRPDVAGYYDLLEGESRKILELKPGLTSEASLKYFNEEALLATKENPLFYNDTVIFPDKVEMNLNYYYTRSFLGDLRIIYLTFFCRLFKF